MAGRARALCLRPGTSEALWGTRDGALIRLDLRDNYTSAQVLETLAGVYAKLGETSKQQRAHYWRSQASQPEFYEWDKVMKDFEGF